MITGGRIDNLPGFFQKAGTQASWLSALQNLSIQFRITINAIKILLWASFDRKILQESQWILRHEVLESFPCRPFGALGGIEPDLIVSAPTDSSRLGRIVLWTL